VERTTGASSSAARLTAAASTRASRDFLSMNKPPQVPAACPEIVVGDRHLCSVRRKRPNSKEAVMPETYKPGEIVPRDGTAECTQYNGTRDHVKAGTRFAPCDHSGDHHGKDCTWQYV
jgi:hypothetical protein